MQPATAARPSAASLREQVQTGRCELRERYGADGGAQHMLRQHRMLIDRTLKSLWTEAGLPGSLALAAVGGYGRGELFPYSDVDLLVLLPSEPNAELRSKLETLIGSFWDAGLEPGHAVRTVEECLSESAKDITVQTSLLEARWLTGSRSLFSAFARAMREQLDPQLFFQSKRLEQEQRHGKYQESPYNLEPNLKEAPGGLRDLQAILWISRSAGLGENWMDLAARGLITAIEARQLAGYQKFLSELRIRLHYAAGRREDRVLFDYQAELAAQFGYADTPSKRASEQLMQRYYRTAKAITQLNTLLLQNIAVQLFSGENSQPEILNERFQSAHELLEARDADLFERQPGAILESFLLLQQHSELKGMSAATLRALWRARARIDARFRRDPANRALFLQILQQPRGIVHELRRMNQYSILGRYLPAFGKIVGQMQYDLFHAYTVDQHILNVVRNLRRFTMVEFAHEYPQCSRLMAGFERHWLLYVAALFHDIAKGRGGDHSRLGMLDAGGFCRAHGLSREDTELVVFLVEHHLTMSSVAQKQDLSDPDVIKAFASKLKTERRLTALYLLTVADVRGTSPKVWNAWKGKLLEDLFLLARRLLRGDGIGFEQDIQAKQDEALRLLRLYALSDEVKDRLWSQLDVAYFLRHDAQDIAWQTRTLHYRVDTERPVVKARLSPIGEGLQVMIYTRDQRDLFARICGYFEQINYSIADARIHTTRHGYALDTFLLLGPGNNPHYREMINLIETDLADRLQRETPLHPSTRGRVSRQLRHFPITPEVNIRPDEKGASHALSIIAGDRPGLLYAIALVLGKYDINLITAKIVTLGERAEDVFLISGAALANPKTVLQLEGDLLDALQLQ
ncbi:MAG: [protein-PII] uridylyltransferase [Betaproteobacteria bacterium]|nr:MAG: [protein-PII] uridylyltransferase [Betaproteobacteria bacterium]